MPVTTQAIVDAFARTGLAPVYGYRGDLENGTADAATVLEIDAAVRARLQDRDVPAPRYDDAHWGVVHGWDDAARGETRPSDDISAAYASAYRAASIAAQQLRPTDYYATRWHAEAAAAGISRE